MTSKWFFLAAIATAIGCGGGGSGDDSGDRPDSGGWSRDSGGGEFSTATIRGTVWAPGLAPSMVLPDEEIPVAGAIVTYTSVRLGDIPEGAHCERCDDSSAVVTDAKGHFELRGVPEGTHWLSIKKGLFRLDQQVTVQGGVAQQAIELTEEQTTLPSLNDPPNGKYIPKIALATGFWDKVENILGKMHIGEVGADGLFIGSSAAGNFDLYENGGDHDANTIGTLSDLVMDLPKLLTYQILFVGCSSGSTTQLFADDGIARNNLREFVRQGGKLYVTDWSAEWADVLWPEFMVFNGDYDTANVAGPFGSGNGGGNNTATAAAMDRRLRDWLDGQYGPIEHSDEKGLIDATSFEVGGLYDQIREIPNVIGTDDLGNQVVRAAYPWVQGNWGDDSIHPFTVTFEPEGCGRVLYSTYHTSEAEHTGLTPQERVLVFLIMELGVCIDAPDID